MIVFTNYALRQILGNATGGGAGALDGAVVHLFINAITPTADSVVADFTEADYTDYAEQAITWGTAYTNGNNQAEITGNTLVFSAGLLPDVQVVYGAFVTDAGGTNLLYADKFTYPVPINEAGDGLSYIASLVPSFEVGMCLSS